MWIRWTVLCAAVAVLTACSAVGPTAKDGAAAQTAASWSYPSDDNQLREIGWK